MVYASKVDKLDLDKLVFVPKDLRKLSDVVKNEAFKKACINIFQTGSSCPRLLLT